MFARPLQTTLIRAQVVRPYRSKCKKNERKGLFRHE